MEDGFFGRMLGTAFSPLFSGDDWREVVLARAGAAGAVCAVALPLALILPGVALTVGMCALFAAGAASATDLASAAASSARAAALGPEGLRKADFEAASLMISPAGDVKAELRSRTRPGPLLSASKLDGALGVRPGSFSRLARSLAAAGEGARSPARDKAGEWLDPDSALACTRAMEGELARRFALWLERDAIPHWKSLDASLPPADPSRLRR